MAQIGDILAKLGRGELLTTAEQQSIRLWGNQAEYNNAYVAGLQNGRSDILAGNIEAENVTVAAISQKGFRLYLVTDGFSETITTNTPTAPTITGWIERFNYGFTMSGQFFYFPMTGYYNINATGTWAAGSTGYRELSFQSSSWAVSEKKSAAGEGGREHNVTSEVFAEKGDAGRFIVRHTEGSSISFSSPSIKIRLVTRL